MLYKLPDENRPVNLILSAKLSDGSLNSEVVIPLDASLAEKRAAINTWLDGLLDSKNEPRDKK